MSLINTWFAYRRDAIRIKLDASLFVRENSADGSKDVISLKVTNLSHVTVSIARVGFVFKAKKGKVTEETAQPESDFPKRMEARTNAELPRMKRRTRRWAAVSATMTNLLLGFGGIAFVMYWLGMG